MDRTWSFIFTRRPTRPQQNDVVREAKPAPDSSLRQAAPSLSRPQDGVIAGATLAWPTGDAELKDAGNRRLVLVGTGKRKPADSLPS